MDKILKEEIVNESGKPVKVTTIERRTPVNVDALKRQVERATENKAALEAQLKAAQQITEPS